MFDPDREEPFLVQTGEAVRFRAIAETEYAEIEAAVITGTYAPEIEQLDA
jgi:allophanate hydrolase subunit 1